MIDSVHLKLCCVGNYYEIVARFTILPKPHDETNTSTFLRKLLEFKGHYVTALGTKLADLIADAAKSLAISTSVAFMSKVSYSVATSGVAASIDDKELSAIYVDRLFGPLLAELSDNRQRLSQLV
ncbi:MAG: hypothetical protein ACXV8O_09265 [Methylobacter sp.]